MWQFAVKSGEAVVLMGMTSLGTLIQAGKIKMREKSSEL
jgi:hypothetical protein